MKWFFLFLLSFSCLGNGYIAPAPLTTSAYSPNAFGCSFLVRIKDVAGQSPLEWSDTDFYRLHPKDWVNYGQWQPVDDGDHVYVRYSCALCWQETTSICLDCQVTFTDGVSYYWNEYIPAGDDQVEFRAIYDCPKHVARMTPTWWHCDCADIGVPLPEPE